MVEKANKCIHFEAVLYVEMYFKRKKSKE